MLNSITKTEEKQWRLIGYAQALIFPLALITIIYGVAALVGYSTEFEVLYRPLTNGSATNPLTVLCMISLGTGLLLPSYNSSTIWLKRSVLFIAFLISSIRILDVITHSNFADSLTPFHSQVILELEMGKSNQMGFNSALMFTLIAISLILNSFQRFHSAQIIGFISLAFPSISSTGYIYGIDSFYGQMSILTTTTGYTLGIAALMTTAHIGALRAMLSPYIGGIVARIQSVIGLLIPLLLGYLFITFYSTHGSDLFGIFVVSICWFIITLVCFSAIIQEKVDHERRHGEYLLAQAAMHDPLTALANRRKFYEFAQEELNRIQRNKHQLWLLLIDIDYFKKINDTAGHAMGDTVLVNISKTLQESVRNVDLVSRIGGEEFSIILTDISDQGVNRISEKIRSHVEQLNIDGWTDKYGSITISIGCAFNNGCQTIDETLSLADKALYQAKENGRNQVCFASQSESK